MNPRNPQMQTMKPRLLACALASCLMIGAPALHAQSTAATLRGHVTAGTGAEANAEVVVTNVDTGLVRRAQSNAQGDYSLAGLPPGTYRIDVSAGGATTTRSVILRVGQIATLDLPLEAGTADAAAAAQMDTVTVTADAVNETKTSEIATYITPKQIESLPQTSRNFLAFADIVPGVIYSRDGNNGSSSLRGGAQNSNGVNVYIDGIGQKNYVLKGGISGQDQTQGNPFPQAAIAEYKVITQNYKAEFDQLSSVAITALTKSGTNEFHGDVFYDFTNQDYRAKRPSELAANTQVDTQEKQYGASFGGPLIRDQLFFFGSYEHKSFVTPSDINPGENVPVSQLPIEAQGLIGPTSVAFDEDLYFGKLTWTPDENNLVELTGKYRKEDQIDGIGGVNTYGFGSTRKNDETRIDLRYQYIVGDWLNDAHVTFEDSQYEPRPTTTQGYGTHLVVFTDPNDNNGRSVLNYGAGENFQRKGQKGTSFQDDLTWTGLDNHTFKAGFKYKEIKINAFEQNPYSPQYYYDVNESFTVPIRVEFGQLVPGAPDLNVKSKNQQFGLYFQDDWAVNNKLLVNLGIRWDYEKTPSYLNFQPRQELVDALHNWANIQNTDYNIDDYISNGHNRKAFKDAFQPRVGFSYDLFEDQRHVLFGGFGRSYDRNLFDYLALERSSGVFPSYRFDFNTPGHPCDVAAIDTCLAWDPSYYNPANLAALVTANPNLGGEINLINNNLKTPYSDQFSFGMRNTLTVFGMDWNTSATLSHVESKDGIYFALGNRYADGRFRDNPNATWGGSPFGQPIPGFGTLLIADNGIETRNDSFLLSIEKPYTQDSGWGMTLAYTYNHPFENRLHAAESDEHYTFDYPNPSGQGFLPSLGIPRHRLVLTGIVDGPWGTTISAKATYASPIGKEGLNCNARGFDNCFFDPFTPAGTFGVRQIDLAATKNFDVGKGIGLRIRADILNIFNTYNWTDYDTWHGGPTDPNPNFGNRNGDGISTPTRTVKLSLGASF